MELKNIREIQNPLFKRREIVATVEQELNPSRSETQTSLAKKFSTQEQNIKMLAIDGNFGSKEFTITANIYESKEDLEKTETKSKKQRDAEKKAIEEAAKAEAEAKAAAEKPAETPAEETKTEEKTE